MKDSKEKEHRISDLKDMIDNVTDESYEMNQKLMMNSFTILMLNTAMLLI